MIEETLHLDNLDTVEDRVIGSLLLGAISDAMGAVVEGFSVEKIKNDFGQVDKYHEGTHMGIREAGIRCGMYSDDSNSILALSSSIVEKKGFSPQHIAEQYSKFFFSGIKRGYPNSAQKVLKAIKLGMDYRYTGRLVFSDGSYANGGAMRIAPIGIFCREVHDRNVFREYVRLAIISSHVHPEAIDGAYVIARFVQHSMNCKESSDFDFQKTLMELIDECKTPQMRRCLTELEKYLFEKNKEVDEVDEKEDFESNDMKFFRDTLPTCQFQIRATDAVTVVLLGIYRYWRIPLLCVSKIIGYGGDTDTTASMAGNILGALYGVNYIFRKNNKLITDLENKERGRDYIIDLGGKLAKVELPDPNVKPVIQELSFHDIRCLERWSKTFTLLQSLEKMPSLSNSRSRISNLDEETKRKLDGINSIHDLEGEHTTNFDFEDLKLRQSEKENQKMQERIILHNTISSISTLTTNLFVIECDKNLNPMMRGDDPKTLHHLVGGPKFFQIQMELAKKLVGGDQQQQTAAKLTEEGRTIEFYTAQGKSVLFVRSPSALYAQPPEFKILKYEKGKFSEDKRRVLERLYWDILLFGKRKGFLSVAIPVLSTSEIMFGFTEHRIEVAKIAIRTVRKFLAQYRTYDTVVFVVQSVENQEIYEKILQFYFPR